MSIFYQVYPCKTAYYNIKVLLISKYAPLLIHRSKPQEVFLGTAFLKICSKLTGEHSCQSTISIKLQSNFIEITFWHECYPVNLLHIFRTLFPKNISGEVLLNTRFEYIYE